MAQTKIKSVQKYLNKILQPIGITGALFLTILAISGCQQSSTQADVLNFDQPFLGNPNPIKFSYPSLESNDPPETKPINPISKYQEPPKIVGGFMTYPAKVAEAAPVSLAQKVQENFSTFPQKNDYQTVILLNQTDYKSEDFFAFTYTKAGVLASYIKDFDNTTLEKLLKTRTVKDLGEINEKSRWNSDAIKEIPKIFPNAKIVLLSINKEATDETINQLAYSLDLATPEKTLVISLTTKVNAPDQTYQEFYDDFTNEVIPSADIDRFDDLPVNEYATAKLLGYYLNYRKALALTEDLSNTATLNVWYQKGQPIKTSDKIFLTAFGDIMLGRAVRAAMDKNGLEYPFEKMNNNYLRVNDLLIANLEGPVTKNAVRTTEGMSFGFFPDVVPVIKKYHFDIVSQANNHTLDKKQSGWEESMGHLRDGGVMVFGYPKEITEDSIKKITIRGQKLAFLGMEEVTYKINDDKAVETVKSLAAEGYKVIPFIHWGIEYIHSPTKRQQELAHKLIDAGAIAVIAHHPHVVESYENYNGHPILYSLGNAIFDQYWSADTQVGLSIGMEISDNETKTFLMPIKLPKSQFQLMDSDQKESFLNEMSTYGDSEKESVKSGKITTSF
jgi:poly-gamma-glutamate synthesis protein (capsule biosynthesis protein)